MPSTPILYDILGIDKSATPEDVRKAYKRKALETHPDKLDAHAPQEEKVRTEELFRKVCEAFAILSDPQKRKAYDATLESKAATSEELKRKMKDRQEWAERMTDQHRNITGSKRPSLNAYEVSNRLSLGKREGQDLVQRKGEVSDCSSLSKRESRELVQKKEKALNKDSAKQTIESEPIRLQVEDRLEDRLEGTQKNEEESVQHSETLKQEPSPQDLRHEGLVTNLVKEMAEALNDAIPGWLERKQKAEQVRAEHAVKMKMTEAMHDTIPDWRERRRRAQQLKAAQAVRVKTKPENQQK